MGVSNSLESMPFSADAMASMVASLPLARLMVGGDVLELQGRNGWLNPAPLLSEKWAHGRFTSQEWSQLVSYLNASVNATPGLVGTEWHYYTYRGRQRASPPWAAQVAAAQRALADVAPQWAARGVILTLHAVEQCAQTVPATFAQGFGYSVCTLYASMAHAGVAPMGPLMSSA